MHSPVVQLYHPAAVVSQGCCWFLGKVVAYDPFRVAHYMHFFRERPDRARESVDISNTWIQLWRSTEHLLDENPAI